MTIQSFKVQSFKGDTWVEHAPRFYSSKDAVKYAESRFNNWRVLVSLIDTEYKWRTRQTWTVLTTSNEKQEFKQDKVERWKSATEKWIK